MLAPGRQFRRPSPSVTPRLECFEDRHLLSSMTITHFSFFARSPIASAGDGAMATAVPRPSAVATGSLARTPFSAQVQQASSTGSSSGGTSSATAAAAPASSTADDQNPVDDLVNAGSSNGLGSGDPAGLPSADESLPVARSGDLAGSGTQGSPAAVGNEPTDSPGPTSVSSSAGVDPSGQHVASSPDGNLTVLMSRDVRGLTDATNSILSEGSAIQPPEVLWDSSSGAHRTLVESREPTSPVVLVKGKVPTHADGMPLEVDVGADGVCAPTHAQLITDFLPLDRRSLETAIDHFLEKIEVLDVGLPDLEDLEGIAFPLAAGALTFVGAKALMKKRRNRQMHWEDSDESGDPIVHPLLGLIV
jgi:hypothetical protein